METEIDTAPDVAFVLRRIEQTFATPAIFLPVLFAFLVVGIIFWFRRNETRLATFLITVGVVTFCSLLYLGVAYLFKDVFSWYVLLAPFLLVALVYVALMYVRDSHSVSGLWAFFLGFLRVAVYASLACVFLLPSCQYYDKTERRSKVVVIFDVSRSMQWKDEIAKTEEEEKTLPSRQDKVIKFLTTAYRGENNKTKTFTEHLLEKNPVACYRFGLEADLTPANPKGWSRGQWETWLKPDPNDIKIPEQLDAQAQQEAIDKANKEADARSEPHEDRQKILTRALEKAKTEAMNKRRLYVQLLKGTNLGGSVLSILKQESANLIQGIIIVSDGRSNQGSEEMFRELYELATIKTIPILTVGVGQFQQRVSIRVSELLAPQTARPDDKFPVRVPVTATGLKPDDPFKATLLVQRILDKDGNKVDEKAFELPEQEGKFKGNGDNLAGEVEYIIDVQDLQKVDAREDEGGKLEGTWQFIAKVPKHPDEAFKEKFHVNDPPTKVQVLKRKLRVLLFASGPTRDFQFLRNMLYREAHNNRVELSILLQNGNPEVEQDPGDKGKVWNLTQFPDKITEEDLQDPHSRLMEYDTIIAMDVDWTKLEKKQTENVFKWVDEKGGGLVIVAGPIHTYLLARPGKYLEILNPIMTLCPVRVKDARLHGLGTGHNPAGPDAKMFPLKFTNRVQVVDFLKLDERGDTPTAGWKEFFWGRDAKPADKDAEPLRGFYNYYPLDDDDPKSPAVKPAAIVLAEFDAPYATIYKSTSKEQRMPWLVTMPVGKGKTAFIASSELWRLRGFKVTKNEDDPDKSYDISGEKCFEQFWIKLGRYVGSGSTLNKYAIFSMKRETPAGPVHVEAQLFGRNSDYLAANIDPRPKAKLLKVDGPIDRKVDTETPTSINFVPRAGGEWRGWFAADFRVLSPGDYNVELNVPGTGQVVTGRFTVTEADPEMENLTTDFGQLYQMASKISMVEKRMSKTSWEELNKRLGQPTGAQVKEAKEAKDGKEAKEVKEEQHLFFSLTNGQLIPETMTSETKTDRIKGKLLDLWDQGWVPEIFGSKVGLSHVLALIVGLLCVEWLTRKLLKLA
jgi:hypothetical protein